MGGKKPSSVSRFFRAHILFMVLIVAWTGLHLNQLDGEYLWYDELCSVLSANGRRIDLSRFIHSPQPVVTTPRELYGFFRPPDRLIGDFFSQQAAADLHPPLFFLLLRFLMWAGVESVSGLVLLPMLICLAAFAVIYFTSSRTIPRPFHVLAPGLWMFTVTGYYIGAEVRQYCLYLFLAAAVIEGARRARLDPELFKRPLFIILFGASLGLGLLTQYLFAFLIMGVDLWLFAWLVRNHKQRLSGLLAANITGALVVAPWVPSAIKQFGYQTRRFLPDWGLLEIWHQAAETYLNFFIAPEGLFHLSFFLVTAFVLLGLYRPPFPGFRGLFIATSGCCFVLPVLLISLRVVKISQIFDVRYFVTFMPVLYLAFAAGVAAFPYRRARLVLLLVLLALIAWNHVFGEEERKRGHKLDDERIPFRTLTKTMEQKHGHDFAVVSDFQSIQMVELSRFLPRDTTVIMGQCHNLPSFLGKWSDEHRPPAIIFSHIKGVSRRFRKDCGEQIRQRLGPDYVQAGKTFSGRRWEHTMFMRTEKKPPGIP